MILLLHRSGNLALAWVCLSFLVTGWEAWGQSESDLLTMVRAQHRAARESIRTFSADVTREVVFPTRGPVGYGKYWRACDTVRLQEYPPGTATIQDALLKDGEIRRVARRRISEDRYGSWGAGRDSASGMLGSCDVWRYVLIDFFGPSEGRYDYDRFLDLANRPPRVRRETIDGHDCIRVSMTCDAADGGDEWSMTFWHDVRCNFLICKVAATFGNKYKDWPMEYEVLEFQEAKPGVSVPVRASLRGYDHGKLRVEEMTTLSNVRVNEALRGDVFTLPPVPAGTMLSDQIEGTRYPIDENWKRIGPTSLMVVVPGGHAIEGPVLPRPTESSGPATDYQAPSEEDLPPGTGWVLPTAVVVVAASGAYLLYRRRPSAGQQTARPQGR